MTEAELLQSYLKPRLPLGESRPRHRAWIIMGLIPVLIGAYIIITSAHACGYPLSIFAIALFAGLPLGALVLLLPASYLSKHNNWRKRLPRFAAMFLFLAIYNLSVDTIANSWLHLPNRAAHGIFVFLFAVSFFGGAFISFILWLWRDYTKSC